MKISFLYFLCSSNVVFVSIFRLMFIQLELHLVVALIMVRNFCLWLDYV